MSELHDLVKRWKSDIRGLQAMETQCGRQRQWDEAVRFEVARETMETAVRELENALEDARQ